MATAETPVESSKERWLRERYERVLEAQRMGVQLNAALTDIYLAAGPGMAGMSDGHFTYKLNDGRYVVVYGPEANYVRQDDPQELRRQVFPGSGKRYVGGKREVFQGYAIRTIDYDEVRQHAHVADGLLTPIHAYVNGYDTTKPYYATREHQTL